MIVVDLVHNTISSTLTQYVNKYLNVCIASNKKKIMVKLKVEFFFCANVYFLFLLQILFFCSFFVKQDK